MFGLLKKLFGVGANVDLSALIKEGAVIVDVRSAQPHHYLLQKWCKKWYGKTHT